MFGFFFFKQKTAYAMRISDWSSVVCSSDLAALGVAVLVGGFPAPVGDFEALVSRMVEIASWVPAGVKLGFHLCYGDANHAHFKDPEDTALMVRVMNHIATHVERPVDWFHLPVPIDRDDTGYFEPLTGLEAGIAKPTSINSSH